MSKGLTITLTNDLMTLWELGHRLAGEHPYRWRIFRVSPAVRDNFRLLLNEILEGNMESTLIMEKWRPGADTSEDMHIRYYLDNINQCIQHGIYQASFLKSVAVDRWEFRHWCIQSGYPLPDFWYGHEYNWPDDYDEETASHDGAARRLVAEPQQPGMAAITSEDKDHRHDQLNEDDNVPEPADKLRPSTRTSVACQEVAKTLWKDNPDMNISEMIQHDDIQRKCGANHYEKGTVHTWLRKVAPLDKRGKPGRPKKNK